MSEKNPIEVAREILEAELKSKKKEVEEASDETTEEEEEEVEEAKQETTEGDCEGEDCGEDVEENATAHAADGAKTAPKAADGEGTEIKTDEGPDNAKKHKKQVDMKSSNAKADKQDKLDDHMTALFSGEELSEEFKTKAETIFEAAVNSRVEDIRSALVENYETTLEETKEEFKNTLSERLNDYLTYVVEEWVKDNEIALDRGIRDDIAEDFLTGLRNLFVENNISIPEEKYDLVDEYAARIETLEEDLNAQMENNVALAKEVRSSKCVEIFAEVCEGLVDTDVEKLRSLAEGIEFENVEQYREKVQVLKDSYFAENNTPETATFQEETPSNLQEENSDLKGSMAAYAGFLGKMTSHPKSDKNDGIDFDA